MNEFITKTQNPASFQKQGFNNISIAPPLNKGFKLAVNLLTMHYSLIFLCAELLKKSRECFIDYHLQESISAKIAEPSYSKSISLSGYLSIASRKFYLNLIFPVINFLFQVVIHFLHQLFKDMEHRSIFTEHICGESLQALIFRQ